MNRMKEENHGHLIALCSQGYDHNHASSFQVAGDKAVNTIQACISIRSTYEYLIIHDISCEEK